RIPDAAISFGEPVKDLAGNPDVVPVVLSRYPQPQNVGPELVYNLLRLNDVSQRFGHLLAFTVDHESVGQHCMVRGPTSRPDRRQQRAVEPAPVLVTPLQVELAW